MSSDDMPVILKPAGASLVDRQLAAEVSKIATGRPDSSTMGEVSRLIRERADLLLPTSFVHRADR
jgi:hypothetical protein